MAKILKRTMFQGHIYDLLYRQESIMNDFFSFPVHVDMDEDNRLSFLF